MHFANCANCAAQFGSSWSWKRALQDGHVERRCCKRLEASFRPTVSAGEPVVMREGRVGFAHDADLHFAAPQLQPAACACTPIAAKCRPGRLSRSLPWLLVLWSGARSCTPNAHGRCSACSGALGKHICLCGDHLAVGTVRPRSARFAQFDRAQRR